jgi:hypothetical protein
MECNKEIDGEVPSSEFRTRVYHLTYSFLFDSEHRTERRSAFPTTSELSFQSPPQGWRKGGSVSYDMDALLLFLLIDHWSPNVDVMSA